MMSKPGRVSGMTEGTDLVGPYFILGLLSLWVGVESLHMPR